jgi:hypothetical protein
MPYMNQIGYNSIINNIEYFNRDIQKIIFSIDNNYYNDMHIKLMCYY